jgi:ubiquinone/menaquinone biosynthesis C-methylase UbiE
MIQSSTIFNLNDPALVSLLDEIPFWSAPFGLKLLEKIAPRKNLTVLDIGFGTGFPLVELAMRLGDTCKVYGIDPWQAATERTREKIRVFGINNIELFDNVALLPDHSIDLIVSNNGLNNVPDFDLTIADCARLLKTSGKLIFTMNLEDTMMEFYNVMKEVLLARKMDASIQAMHEHIYAKRRPLDEVIVSLLNHNLTVDSVEHNEFFYSFTNGTAMFNHFFIRLAFLGPWLEIVPENYREEIFSEIEKKINELAAKDGFFKLSVPFVVFETIKK